MRFLLGRYERTASEFYQEYADNNELFAHEPVKEMSKLTRNLLRAVDYGFVKDRRTDNFQSLHKRLSCFNRLSLDIPDGAFMYPLWIENGGAVRKKLQKQKIYIPTLWPDVFDVCREPDVEFDMAQNILPLPVDQRYTEEDMEYIADKVIGEITAAG